MNRTRKYVILTILALVVPFLTGASATNSVPQGSHEGSEQSQHNPLCWAYGYAFDPDNVDAKVQVRVLSDGKEVARDIADHQDTSGVCPGGACRFEVYLWHRIPTGTAHTIAVQAQDVQTRQWVNLSNTPRQLRCFAFDLKVLDLDKGTVTSFPADLPDYGFIPSWSPRGDKIAFGDWAFKHPKHPALWDYFSNIHITDLATCKTQVLEGTENGDGTPAWSPDGRTIAFQDSSASIYLLPVSGGVRQLLRTDAVQPDWSPDGSRIAFYQASDNSVRTIDVNTGSETVITSFPTPTAQGAYPKWSPDGHWIAFNNDAADIFKIEVDDQGYPTGPPVQVTANSRQEADACWSADSSTLFFQSEISLTGDPLNEQFDVWAVAASGGNPIRLTNLTGPGVNVGCWRNGNRIAYAGINKGASERWCRPTR